MLTIEQMLAAKERKVEEVPVPEWDDVVYVRRLSALEAIEFSIQLKGITGTDSEIAQARLAASLSTFLCDPDGNPMASIEQARALERKSATIVYRIVMMGHKINATDDAQVEAIAKNSAPSPAAISPSN